MHESDGHEIVNRHLQSCLRELLQAGLSHPDAAVHAESGWTILLTVFPSKADTAPSAPTLTECDRHCLTLLAMQQRPISCYKMCKELEHQNIGVWGLSTIKRSLRKLKRLRLVLNSRRAPRGYYLPEKQSLFLRHLANEPKF